MPRYFFDVDDGERQTRDEVGMYLPGVDHVEHETRTLLQNLSVPEVLNGRDRVFTATVRDQAGTTVYRATAMLKIDRSINHRRMPPCCSLVNTRHRYLILTAWSD